MVLVRSGLIGPDLFGGGGWLLKLDQVFLVLWLLPWLLINANHP